MVGKLALSLMLLIFSPFIFADGSKPLMLLSPSIEGYEDLSAEGFYNEIINSREKCDNGRGNWQFKKVHIFAPVDDRRKKTKKEQSVFSGVGTFAFNGEVFATGSVITVPLPENLGEVDRENRDFDFIWTSAHAFYDVDTCKKLKGDVEFWPENRKEYAVKVNLDEVFLENPCGKRLELNNDKAIIAVPRLKIGKRYVATLGNIIHSAEELYEFQKSGVISRPKLVCYNIDSEKDKSLTGPQKIFVSDKCKLYRRNALSEYFQNNTIPTDCDGIGGCSGGALVVEANNTYYQVATYVSPSNKPGGDSRDFVNGSTGKKETFSETENYNVTVRMTDNFFKFIEQKASEYFKQSKRKSDQRKSI